MMANKNERNQIAKGQQSASGDHVKEPEWASGLKQLYDSVVEEPLPQELTDLLSQLDDGGAE